MINPLKQPTKTEGFFFFGIQGPGLLHQSSLFFWWLLSSQEPCSSDGVKKEFESLSVISLLWWERLISLLKQPRPLRPSLSAVTEDQVYFTRVHSSSHGRYKAPCHTLLMAWAKNSNGDTIVARGLTYWCNPSSNQGTVLLHHSSQLFYSWPLQSQVKVSCIFNGVGE